MDASHCPPAELGDDDVQVLIAIKICRLDVGDPADPGEQTVDFKLATPGPPEPNHRSRSLVGRFGPSEIRDQQVGPAVPVQVNDLGMARIGEFGDGLKVHPAVIGIGPAHPPGNHVADHQFGALQVRGQFQKADVGRPGLETPNLRAGEEPAIELKLGASLLRGPRRRVQMRRRFRLEVGGHS